MKLQENVKTITKDLVTNEIIRWSKVRDKFSRLAAKLEGDRTSGSYRYQTSIEDLLERCGSLEKSYDQMHKVLFNFD